MTYVTIECNIHVQGMKVKQLNIFVCLRSMFTRYCKMGIDIKRRVNGENKVNGALNV